MIPIALLIEDLAGAVHLPVAALRKALEHPDAVAEATLPVLVKAATGAELEEREANLLFWGLHVMAQARDTRALGALLALLRQDIEVVEAVLGDAVSATLSRVLASVYDGHAEPLFRLILDSSLDDGIREAVLKACITLCLTGRIERDALHRLLVRFDEAKASVEGDIGWSAWEEAIATLGLRDLAPRVEAARKDGRIDPEFSDPDWFKDTLREAERHPHDLARLPPDQYGFPRRSGRRPRMDTRRLRRAAAQPVQGCGAQRSVPLRFGPEVQEVLPRQGRARGGMDAARRVRGFP